MADCVYEWEDRVQKTDDEFVLKDQGRLHKFKSVEHNKSLF